MPYSIRPALLSDLPAFARVERKAGALFKTIGLDILADDVADPEFVASFIRVENALVVVDASDTVVGFALAFNLDGALHLQEMSVDPAHGRKGLGGNLLKAVDEIAKSRHLSVTTLSTFIDVPWNAPFYARHGYRIAVPAEWTPGFHILRAHEVHEGLPAERRCFMKKSVSESASKN
ncbi:MAG: GNAT family N-acetyltransferase [Rhodobiaceae bacterium]|nr:GNAT family N-acetyltransferase [Rhodobiaceae bacterium]